ncbi:hypothetical protein K503DRAFT_778127 [Rhizopogon vinicolor AM-OR11-026]|uniref:Uncharacterized protein n=1 Tax=Rhizopogon vinicolor AM-OR11-026 TaxID=1314800 RepID=A0A1B7MD80_9AGAM|nr:hypothetical protein K503DRAFT_778127 [Rhizopogon vinicolor AM-OR11-026]
MFNLFRLKDDTFSHRARCGQYVEKFLSGKCQHSSGSMFQVPTTAQTCNHSASESSYHIPTNQIHPSPAI